MHENVLLQFMFKVFLYCCEDNKNKVLGAINLFDNKLTSTFDSFIHEAIHVKEVIIKNVPE